MAIQLVGGISGSVAEVGVAASLPAHVTAKPVPYGSLGHFRYGGFTGILPAALTANSEIFQFRWTHATNLAIIQKIKISACVSTTFFAAGVPVQIDMVKATGWSVQGTGGTGVTPSATLKDRTSMSSTAVASGDLRIATTAALGAGTKTLEANSMGAIAAPGPIIPPGTVLYEPDLGDGEHPLVFIQNEGFVIRSVAVPATGTWTAAIQIDWAEVTAF
jgi:hypothetical protein